MLIQTLVTKCRAWWNFRKLTALKKSQVARHQESVDNCTLYVDIFIELGDIRHLENLCLACGNAA